MEITVRAPYQYVFQKLMFMKQHDYYKRQKQYMYTQGIIKLGQTVLWTGPQGSQIHVWLLSPSCPTNLVKSWNISSSMLIQKANCKSDELNFLLYGPQLGTFSLVLPLYHTKIKSQS